MQASLYRIRILQQHSRLGKEICDSIRLSFMFHYEFCAAFVSSGLVENARWPENCRERVRTSENLCEIVQASLY